MTMKQQIEKLASTKQSLENRQASLQMAVDAHASSTLLRVVDMPDEILIRIFSILNEDRSISSTCPKALEDIRNVRLACWRFCNTSSHLLVNRVTVEMNPQSLSHLRDISSHPMIKMGVQKLRVVLRYYDSLLAESITAFAEFNANLLRDCVEESMERVGFGGFIGEVDRKFIKAGKALADSWSPSPAANEAYNILRRAHEKYGSLFEAQEKVRSGGAFVRAVGLAFARMPLARSLEVFDQIDYHWRGSSWMSLESIGDEKALSQVMTTPVGWDDAQKWGSGLPPVEELLKLPGAIYEAGVSITFLHIFIYPPWSFSAPSHTEDFIDFTAALQGLKTLWFSHRMAIGSPYGHTREPSEFEKIGRFFSALLNTSSLQEVQIDLSFLWDTENFVSNPPVFSLGTLVEFRPWGNMSHLSLTAVPIRLQEMGRLMDQLPNQVNLSFDTVLLTSGSWTEVLDILNRKSISLDLRSPLVALKATI